MLAIVQTTRLTIHQIDTESGLIIPIELYKWRDSCLQIMRLGRSDAGFALIRTFHLDSSSTTVGDFLSLELVI